MRPPRPNLDPSKGPIVIGPQQGPQEQFLATTADIAFYGGAAGSGKSMASLMEAARYTTNPNFGAVILRRTRPEITKEGALWDESMKLYPLLGAVPKVGSLQWLFPKGGRVTFDQLQHEPDVTKYHGSQIPLIIFDELTTFTEYQFTYLMSRNRSTCGVRPYMRGTCNPDAASWVKRWIDWYIDPATGYPITDRGGVMRHFLRVGEELVWGTTRDELREAVRHKTGGDVVWDANCEYVKTFTFVPATINDNKILQERDPGYRANLEAQPRIERERLLKGNWLISNAEGEWPADYFGAHFYFEEWPHPSERLQLTMAWDPSKGGNARFGDYSAITILMRDKSSKLWCDAVMGRWSVEEGIDQLIDLYGRWKPDGVAVETNQFQQLIVTALRQRCKQLGIPELPIYEVNNHVHKEVRIRRLGQYLANRNIRAHGHSQGARMLSEQLMTFPVGEHDDGPDSLEMALRLMIELSHERR